MTRSEFLRAVEKMLELPARRIEGGTVLKELGEWDSLAIVDLMAFLDSELGIAAKPEDIDRCKTAGDLLALAGDRIID